MELQLPVAYRAAEGGPKGAPGCPAQLLGEGGPERSCDSATAENEGYIGSVEHGSFCVGCNGSHRQSRRGRGVIVGRIYSGKDTSESLPCFKHRWPVIMRF